MTEDKIREIEGNIGDLINRKAKEVANADDMQAIAALAESLAKLKRAYPYF